MRIFIAKDYTRASLYCAEFIRRKLEEKPAFVLGLPTGSTPEGTYGELVRLHREEGLDFSWVRSFNIDEYVGLPPEDVNSYHRFMEKRLFSGINIPRGRVHIPRGDTGNPQEEAREYERLLEEYGPIDLQFLGIGTNGHIGFNEPGTSFESRTGVRVLSQQTRRDNSRFFNRLEEVPREAITMGLGDFMDAREILLLVSGKHKARAVSGLVTGPLTEELPASVLRGHGRVTVVLDEEAASALPEGLRKERI